MQLPMQQVLLERRRDRRLLQGPSAADLEQIKETTDLAAGAESGQPNRCALLADELRSFFVRDGA